MANYGIIRMAKFKAGDVQGIQKHNQRQGKNSSNKDIDFTKSDMNYDLLNKENIKYERVIKDKISERVKRKPRANSVVLSEFLITASPDYMENLSNEEQKRYFETSLNFIREKYGEENLVYASVHHDEATPHMHVGITPITKDNRLSAKDIFNGRQAMIKLQDEFHAHIVEHRFDLERGQTSDKKHVKIHKFKKESLEKAIENKQKVNEKLDKSIRYKENRLLDIEESFDIIKEIDEVEVKTGGLFASETVKLARSDFESIKDLAKASEVLKTQNRKLEGEVERLFSKAKQFYDELEVEAGKNRELKNEIGNLKNENKKLHNKIGEMEIEKEDLLKQISVFEQVRDYLQNTLEIIKVSATNFLGVSKEKIQSFVGQSRMESLYQEIGKTILDKNSYSKIVPKDERDGAEMFVSFRFQKEKEQEEQKRKQEQQEKLIETEEIELEDEKQTKQQSKKIEPEIELDM